MCTASKLSPSRRFWVMQLAAYLTAWITTMQVSRQRYVQHEASQVIVKIIADLKQNFAQDHSSRLVTVVLLQQAPITNPTWQCLIGHLQTSKVRVLQSQCAVLKIHSRPGTHPPVTDAAVAASFEHLSTCSNTCQRVQQCFLIIQIAGTIVRQLSGVKDPGDINSQL
jgi:hypothetical protein